MRPNPRLFSRTAVVALVVALLGAMLPAVAAAQRTRTPQRRAQKATPAVQDPLAAMEARAAEAEAALREGEVQIAESRYRDALRDGWMLLGALALSENRPRQARDAFRRATASAVDAESAERSLALALLQTGEPAEALRILSRLSFAHPADTSVRHSLAQALMANGQPEQAIQELEEARRLVPGDLELAFALASGYLHVKKVGEAEALFKTIRATRPGASTHVLIGRTYRDFGEYQRARAALQTAIKMDPRVRRAHYYLGTITIMEEGYVRVDEAAAAFRAELALAPDDPVTHLRLGIVLEEAKRHDEALPSLERAAREPSAAIEAFEYLGRCQLALGRTAEAVVTLQRALDEATGASLDTQRIGRIHYQMANALRSLGREQDAAKHFAIAERSSELRTENTRERLAQYLSDTMEPRATDAGTTPVGPDQGKGDRAALRKRVTGNLARAYLNMGVVHARAARFARAASFFEGAAAADPAFPQVQYSLGVAYFNAQQFDKATGPLERAAAEPGPAQSDVRRMLALSWLNLESYDKAAALLKDDPRQPTDPSLQYAYALALVKTGRAEEAQRIFGQLLAAHGDSPDLIVLLGQAHAQQGNYPAAIEALQRALRLKPDVRFANGALGLIYFQQGQLDEAAAALRSELRVHPRDARAMQTLAAVLELKGEAEDALALLRSALKIRPEFADARYLLGKLLLARGSTGEAVDHLEAAARLAPDDANVHFQLAQAYEKSGRTELAQQAFDRYRVLKDKKREVSR